MLATALEKKGYYITLPVNEIAPTAVHVIVDKLYAEAIDTSLSKDLFAVQLQLKVNGVFRSISKTQVVDNTTKAELKEVLSQGVRQLYSHYQDMDVSCLFIRYAPVDKTRFSLAIVACNGPREKG